jgi:predicted DNA-binding transcriptional regulator YafY
MARTQQVIRLFRLLRVLEGPRGASLAELAESIPEDFARHPRTIRRDLAALEASGYPLVTERVDGQTRWRLLEGFRHLPRLAFTPTELLALELARDLLTPLEGTYLRAALEAALAKVSAALPPEGARLARELKQTVAVSLGPHKSYRTHPETVETLSRAIAECRTVRMRYFSASRGRTTWREVDPYRLWYAASGLYLIAWDHRRQDFRTFAVERIRELALTDRPYQLPLAFDLDAYIRDALVVMRGAPTRVELLFDRATAAWVRDRLWHPSQRLVPLRDGRLRMALEVADTPELVGWILSFRSGVQVLRPPALRERVQEEARRIAAGAAHGGPGWRWSPRKPPARTTPAAGVGRLGAIATGRRSR